MPMKFRFSTLAITLAIIVLAIATSLAAQNSSPELGAAKRSITEKDLFHIVWIAEPQVSPRARCASIAGWRRSPHRSRSAEGRGRSSLVAGQQAHRVLEFDHARV